MTRWTTTLGHMKTQSASAQRCVRFVGKGYQEPAAIDQASTSPDSLSAIGNPLEVDVGG